MKHKRKNEWYRFTDFISSSCERKIENQEKWYASKHAGGGKTVRRRIVVEIDITAFKMLKGELIENARMLANDSSHRKWVNQSRADARGNKYPDVALKRAEERILWWNDFCTLIPIGSKSYQKQALLYIMNSEKSAIKCLVRALIKQKFTNIEFLKIVNSIDVNSPVKKVVDTKTGKKNDS
ncbi:MAG: hypothetical protein ACFE9L_14630 [Candidatus Hodarchaeota archaeon]